MSGPWPADLIARCKALWDTKDYSSAQIAKLLGGDITRNAVIGQAHRRKWTPRDECKANGYFEPRVPTAKPPKPKKQPRTILKHVKEPTLPANTPAPEGGVPFMLTTSRQCRWPTESDLRPAHALMICCGAGVIEDRPYCRKHARMAAQPKQPKRVREPYEASIMRRAS